MYKAEDGTVLHDDNFIAPAFFSSPTIAPVHRGEEGRGQVRCLRCDLVQPAGQLAGAAACPNRCLDFGDMDELKAKYGSDLVSELPVFPGSDTQPCVLIKAKDCAKKELGEKLYL